MDTTPVTTQGGRCWITRQDVVRIARNSLYAALARLVVGLVKGVVKRGVSRKLLSLVVDEVFSMDPWKWAAVSAGFSSLPNLSALLRRVLAPTIASAAAGAVAALPVLVMQPRTRTELMLYFLARSLHAFASGEILPRLPLPMRSFEHYDVLTMMASSAEILYAFVFLPKAHSPSYYGFLQRATMVDPRVLSATEAAHRCTPCPALVDVARVRGVTDNPVADGQMTALCTLYHPGKSCNEGIAHFFVKHFSRLSFPLYLPLKVIATVVLHAKKLRRDPVTTLVTTIKSSARSALFLTAYCATSLRLICLFSQREVRSDIWIALLAGGIAGSATLIEEKPRRLDLAVYCLMQALRSSTLLLYRKGIIALPSVEQQDALYVASVAYLFATFETNCSKLHPTVVKMFSFFTGQAKDARNGEGRSSPLAPVVTQ